MKNLPTKQSTALMSIIRQIIVFRDGEKCLRCHTTERLQMSHIYPKGRYRGMEYFPENIKFLCYSCHFHFWHKHPIDASDWAKQAIPKARLDKLRLMSQTYLGKFDYKLHKLYLEQELKRYTH